MADSLTDSLVTLLAPVVAEAGCFLEGVETTRAGRYSVVRVLVDLVDGPGDMTVDALQEVSRAVSDALEEADPVKGQYTLEVSTPGAERALVTPRHLRRAVGHTVTLSTRAGDGHEITGRLLGVEDGVLSLKVDGEVTPVPLEEVAAAHMVVTLAREGDEGDEGDGHVGAKTVERQR